MRTLALSLILCFAFVPLEAATRHTSSLHPVKAQKGKKAPKARKGKRPVKHTGHA